MGVLDFLGNLFSGGQQQPQQAPVQQGLTNPDLYSQAPPQFELPFAYKLAMLGSSINKGYGGGGGMDVGGLAEAYMKQQQDQYTWQQEQAEKQRKYALVEKYIEKTGNTALADLYRAYPDEAVKFIFETEKEKLKPQPPHDRAVTKLEDGTIIDNNTGQVVYKPPPPPPLSYLGEGGETGGAVAPAAGGTAVTAAQAGGDPRKVGYSVAPASRPDTGGMGDTLAPTITPTTTTPVVAPKPAAGSLPPFDTTDLPAPTVDAITDIKTAAEADLARLYEEKHQLYLSGINRGIDLKDFYPAVTALNNAITETRQKAQTDMATQAEKGRATISAAAGTTILKRDASGKLVPDYVAPAALPTSAQEDIYRKSLPPDQQAAYDKLRAGPLTLERQVEYLKGLPDEAARKQAMDILRAPAAVTPSPADVANAGVTGKLAEKDIELGNNATAIYNDFATMKELTEVAPQGWTKDAVISSVIRGYSGAADTFSSLASSLAPRLRVVGSGSSSDADVNLTLRSLPSLLSNPDTNRAVVALFEARFKLDTDRAAAARQYLKDNDKDKYFSTLDEIANRKIVPEELKVVLNKERERREKTKGGETKAKSIPEIVKSTPELDDAMGTTGQ